MREKASEQMAGQGTNLMRMWPRAAGKWARKTFSSTEPKVWMSAALQEGSPEPVSRTLPPCSTIRSTCVLQERWGQPSWEGIEWKQRQQQADGVEDIRDPCALRGTSQEVLSSP